MGQEGSMDEIRGSSSRGSFSWGGVSLFLMELAFSLAGGAGTGEV